MTLLMTRTKPLALPDMSVPEIAAIKSMAIGEATKEQQILAYETIIKKLCGIGALSYTPEDQSVTAFNEGKRCVGIQMLFLTNEPMSKLKTKTKKEENQ